MYKNLNLTRFVASIVIIVSLSSCYGYTPDPYYVPLYTQKQNIYYLLTSPHSPLLTDKGDFNMNFLLSGNSSQWGGEIQAGYMPSGKIGIMANVNATGNNNRYSAHNNYNRFEIGAGYVASISKSTKLETYAGIGTGTMKNNHYTGTSQLNSTHFFLQPTIAISTPDQLVQFAFVSRFMGVNFNVKDTSFNSGREAFSHDQLVKLDQKPFHFMWEPGFIFKAGWENFQFHTGVSLSADLSDAKLHRPKATFAIGFTIRTKAGKKTNKIEEIK